MRRFFCFLSVNLPDFLGTYFLAVAALTARPAIDLEISVISIKLSTASSRCLSQFFSGYFFLKSSVTSSAISIIY